MRHSRAPAGRRTSSWLVSSGWFVGPFFRRGGVCQAGMHYKERAMPALLRTWLIVGAALAGGVGLRWVLDPWLGPQLPLITLFAAMALAAALGGFGATLLVSFLGYLACRWLFIEPRGNLG